MDIFTCFFSLILTEIVSSYVTVKMTGKYYTLYIPSELY